MKQILVLASSLVFLFSCSEKQVPRRLYPWQVADAKIDVAKYVDPFIGTGGHGHTFPGATAPFGMVQLSPDTRLDGWDGCSGYHYSDSIVYGFSHTHLSGTGCSDYGDILLMPFADKKAEKDSYATSFSHKDEKAEAGYYSVKLPQHNVSAELTASPRTGFHRYNFSSTDSARLFIDLVHRDEVLDSKIEIVNDTVIRGYRFSKAWAADQRLYFCIYFSKPSKSQIIRSDDKIVNADSVHSKKIKSVFSFEPSSSQPLLVKVGLSAVSMDNAELNLLSEIPGWDFDATRAKVKQAWNVELGRIEAKGGTDDQMKIFYTALYHCFTAPNLYSDVDGSYRGRDMKIYRDTLQPQYTVFSLWDTYRALHPLFTLVQQDRTNGFIQTFIRQWQQGGRLPVWELSANETECMIGYHAVPVIADAWVKGIRGFDTSLAYAAMRNSAMLDHFGLRDYKSCGFIPAEGEGESVSRTLEYAYDDWCIAQIAKRMNKKEDYEMFIRRAQSWKNLFDPKTKFMRARLNNAFVEPFAPAEVNFHYTEANSWQYSMYVPHDMNGLTQAIGGKQELGKWLDNLFTVSSQTSGRDQADISGLIGQYAHGNEPSHHMTYLYCFAGRPYDTQRRVAEVCRTLYTPRPDGLSGNEDCGQMSAWYVMSSLGFYAVTPGTDQYVLGTPQFPEIILHFENGKDFKITAENFSAVNRYSISVSVNGKEHHEGWIDHQTLLAGGGMTCKMGESPLSYKETVHPAEPADYIAPQTSIPAADEIPSAPRISNTTERTLIKGKKLQLELVSPGAKIFCSVNNEPFAEKSSVNISEKSTLRTYAVSTSGKISDTAVASFTMIDSERKIELATEYAPQYAANGKNALIDGLRGTTNFRTGSWQGYEGNNIEAVVDLGANKKIDSVSCGFLQDQGSWIFMPVKVEYFVSDDGKNWTSIGTVNNTTDAKTSGSIVRYYAIKGLNKRNARYVKMVAGNMGKCPDWHPGKGNNAWLFADEMVIE